MSEIDGSPSRTFERPEAEQLVQDVADDALALVQAERRLVALAFEHAADQRADLGLGVFALDAGQAIEVEPVEQILMDAALQLLIAGVSGICLCTVSTVDASISWSWSYLSSMSYALRPARNP